MYSFKFYYLEACDLLKVNPNDKILSRIEQSGNSSNLNLSTVQLVDDTCKAIGEALKKDVFLEELDLSNCMLGDKGLSSILAGLETNKFLRSLNLKGNSIRSIGTECIGKLLRHNNHLQNLDLEWNATGTFPEKFSILCEALCMNTSLKSLDLRNNHLNHLSAQSISGVLYRNSTLQKLDLCWNSIGLIGGRIILKSLAKNRSILQLHITGNDVPFEIEKSIEIFTLAAAERYLKNSENLEKTKFFASKLQNLESEKNRQLKSFMEQLEKKDQDLQLNERWNCEKITHLQETIAEKDDVINNLSKKVHELEKKLALIIDEKNGIALEKHEMETKYKERKKDFEFFIDKEKKEAEANERKFLEEIGIKMEENLFLKKEIQDNKVTQENLEDEIVKLKSTIAKLEKMSKLQEKSLEEQTSILSERYADHLKELELERKNEISRLKEEFSEVEKDFKQKINLLESRKNYLEKQIVERDEEIQHVKIHSEAMLEELKKQNEQEEEKFKKQYEERIELLKSANTEKDELLKRQLEALYEIRKKATENDILFAQEAHERQNLEHIIRSKDDEMNATIAKIKLEVKEQLEELRQVKESLEISQAECALLKKEIRDTEKQHTESLKKKNEIIENLEQTVENLEWKVEEAKAKENKLISNLQAAVATYINSEKDFEDGDKCTITQQE